MKTNTPRTDEEYDGLLWRIKNQLPPNWTPEDAGIWMANFARTLELELRTAQHELSMIAEDVEAYRTDCSTPTFQVVRNMKEQLQIRDAVETCSQCGKGWNPSYIESGWCMSCIIVDVKKTRDQLRAELCAIKCELALSTKSDDEKPIVTTRGMSQTITELHAEVERLSALKTMTLERYLTEAQKEIMNERDQWHDMARELAVHCKLHEPIDYRITVSLTRFATMEKGMK